jgi:hypothetical protein
MKSTVVWCVALAGCHQTPQRVAGDAASPDAASADAAADALPMIDAATGSADPFGGLVTMTPACSKDSWCWWQPTPSGTFYNRIVSSSPDNIWLVGGGPPGYAAILQWDGKAWKAHTPPVPTNYPAYLFPMAVSTISQTDTWLVYGNLVEHWDGAAWTIVQTNTASSVTLNGVWVDPGGDAWVTASDGSVTRWHGGTSTVFATGSYMGSIWGTAADDIFVTTVAGLFHYDGSGFARIYSGPATAGWYQGVKNDVWISGDNATILHWDGHTITALAAPGVPTHGIVQSADYAAATDISWIATGATAAPTYRVHWDGAQLTSVAIDQQASGLGEAPCGQLGSARVIDGKWWVVCADGGVATMTGSATLTAVISPWTGTGSFWGTSQTDLYLATGTDLRHWDGTSWTRTPQPVGGIRGVQTSSGNVLFGMHAVAGPKTTTYLDRFDGTAWTSMQVTQFTSADPSQWLSSVVPLGPDEALLVGNSGGAYHYQAGSLTPIASGTTADLADVWAPDSDHAYVTGAGGTLLLWDRAEPGLLKPDVSFPATTEDLRAIAGAGGLTWVIAPGQTHVWVRPASGVWQTVNTGVIPVAIAAINDHNVVVVGADAGEAARWNGMTFVGEIYPSWRGLQTLYALGDGTTYLSGLSGVITHP